MATTAMRSVCDPNQDEQSVAVRKRGIPAMMLIFAGLVFAGLSPAPAFAQAFGSISGSVVDPSGAAVPHAVVTVTETGTGFTRMVASDAGGHYVIPNLRPTEYRVAADASGFKKLVRQGVTLLANQDATLDLHLELGATAESVTVTSQAVQVNTTTQTISDVVDSAKVVDLPLNGRNAVELMNLVPGVNGAGASTVTGQSSLPGSASPSINGSRGNQTNFALDGANFTDKYSNVNVPFPMPDAVEEFSVQTSSYSARYGMNSGGVVNVVTKSGANSIHGDLFEFVRNPVLNARNFFSVTKDAIRRNDFGGTIGGPVFIPHLYNGRDRTFFFFGYQGERYRDVSTSSTYVPTPAELGGDFSSLLDAGNPDNPFRSVVRIANPWPYPIGTTSPGQAFPNNVIPASALDPAALKLARDYLPQVGGTGLVFFAKPISQNINQATLRVDHRLGSKDSLTGRWFMDHVLLAPQNPPGDLLGYNAGYDQPVNNVMIQETHTFRPNLLNQVSFTFSDVPTDKTFTSDSPNVASFGVTGLWLPSQPWIQNIGLNGAFSIPGGAKGPFNARDTGIADNLSWVKGRHNLDLGFSFDRARVDLGDVYLAQGQFSFNATGTGNSIASFMLGYMQSFIQGYGEYKNNRDNLWSFYANDSFHATRRLTLNFGLRYEPYTPWKEIEGRVEQFRINDFYAGNRSQRYVNAPPGLFFPTDPGVPFSGAMANYTDFAPRAGFAYDVTGNGTTSIRGGAGFFYDTGTGGDLNNRFADLSPFSPQVTLTPPPGPFSEPLRGYSGYYPFPFTYPPAKDTPFSLPVLAVSYDPTTKYLVPLDYSWNLTVEHQFPWNTMLEVSYVGSHSIHGQETIELNPAQYIAGSKLGVDARRLFAPYFGSVSMDGQDINSNFNALEVAVKRRMSKQLSLSVAYTFSRALDDYPQGASAANVGAGGYSPIPWYMPGRHQFDYGPSGAAQRLVVSYVWMLPALQQFNPILRGVFGDWGLTGIVTARSGTPFTILGGTDRSGTGINKDRGVAVAGANSFASGPCAGQFCVSYLNKSAFAQPVAGSVGMLGKNSVYGPGAFNWDMGIFKRFPVTERFRAEFRAEFFNAFNHTQLNNPNGTVSAAGFGNITGAAGPRIGQLALKLIF